jgi:phage terminase large subunit
LKQRADRGDLVLLESRHEDNPVLFDPATGGMTTKGAAYLATLDRLTGVRKARLRNGLWVAAEGLIYEDFDPAHHLLDTFKVPQAWRRVWSVDFGFTNPFVLQIWAVDPDGRMFLIHELYRTQRLVEDHARDALELMTQYEEPKPEAVVCDHDAEDRATLERHLGFKTQPAYKGVTSGIQAVQARTKPASDGIARVFIVRDARHDTDRELVKAKKPTCTADEVPGYVWAKPAETNARNAPKEQPVKKDDHGCDAARYAVAYVDDVGRSNGIQDVGGYDW